MENTDKQDDFCFLISEKDNGISKNLGNVLERGIKKKKFQDWKRLEI